MLISRTWLQSYFETELPDAEAIAETLLLHSFEIEEVYEKNSDWIIDIDVLPNRAHDCLSHEGIAREYAMLSGAVLKENRYLTPELTQESDAVTVYADSPNCYRYMAQRMEHISVEASPEWMEDYLSAIDQKSINAVVDATNIIMFETGQPLHAFDADRVIGGITVRNAYEGEVMTTLTGEELVLASTDLVIADQEGVLALAGVKGGTKAEVTKETKNIILEAANFNPLSTRITSRRVKILTDSSKRFENGISSEITPNALDTVVSLIGNIAGNTETSTSKVSDYYPHPETPLTINLNHKKIESVLGISLESNKVEEILKKLSFDYILLDRSYKVTPPMYRLDVTIAEDIIEEIGRVYGYHAIPSKSLDDIEFSPNVHGLIFIENSIKNFLIEKGFNELRNYVFINNGEVELLNPLASDKKAMRDDVQKTLAESLVKNSLRSDYYGTDRTLVFEIAREYHADKEETVCVIGIKNSNKKARKQYGTEGEQLQTLVKELEEATSISVSPSFEAETVRFSVSSVSLDNEVRDYGELFDAKSYADNAVFHGVSPYPYITRDVSFWTEQTDAQELFKDAILNTETKYLKKVYLFDTFQKEGRVSYAYSLIFQSLDKTLTDVEVEEDMKNITAVLEHKGCELR